MPPCMIWGVMALGYKNSTFSAMFSWYQNHSSCQPPSKFCIPLPYGQPLTQNQSTHYCLPMHSLSPYQSMWSRSTSLLCGHGTYIAQGWPELLTKVDHNHINWSLCGLENIQGTQSHALWPPITLSMLHGLKAALNLLEPFDACIWAMASCAFFGMMHFSEVSVISQNTFSRTKHLKHSNVFLGSDLDGKCYTCLDLSSAETVEPGKIQSVYLTA